MVVEGGMVTFKGGLWVVGGGDGWGSFEAWLGWRRPARQDLRVDQSVGGRLVRVVGVAGRWVAWMEESRLAEEMVVSSL